jgi:Zn-dependent membrane protease YugP
MFFDPMYLVFVGPALLLGLWAQFRVQSTYATTRRMPAPLSGAAAARYVLDSAGLQNVAIEQIPGQLSDHYDPREKVLRLSADVYQSQSLAAVGIAAHEAGHALQDAYGYAPLALRNAAVPVAGIGSNLGILLVVIGAVLQATLHWGPAVVWLGIILFSGVVVFQVVNLPVEFNASSRAKQQLVALGIIDQEHLYYVEKMLGAAALTYVAATLQAVMILLYLLMRFGGRRD